MMWHFQALVPFVSFVVKAFHHQGHQGHQGHLFIVLTGKTVLSSSLELMTDD
jgi:hypothetical protein